MKPILKIQNEGGLIGPAEAAGIKVPPDTSHFNISEYPHWNLYRGVQLGRELPKAGDEWHNAVVIAKLIGAEVENATWTMLKAKGFRQLCW